MAHILTVSLCVLRGSLVGEGSSGDLWKCSVPEGETSTLCCHLKVLLKLKGSRKAGPPGMRQRPESRLTHVGFSLQPLLQRLIPILQPVLQHPLHLLDHLEGRAQGLGWPGGFSSSHLWLCLGSLTLLAPAFSFWHLPSPDASRSPPEPSSSAACPGIASAVLTVAAEPGAGGAAPFLDHSSDGRGGGGRRESRGALGPDGPPPAPLLSPPLSWSPAVYVPVPFTPRHFSRHSPQAPFPTSPSSLESAHSANAAPCPSASSCPAHLAAVSSSWMLVVVEALAQGGGSSQLKSA